jgi:hypothetical protein
MLDVADVDAAAAQHIELGLAEIVADRADHSHDVEERSGEREVDGGASKHPLALAKRGLDGVKRDRSNDGYGHRACEG